MNRSYTSETTAFLQSLHAKNPNLAKDQRDGRALLWDQAVQLADLAALQAGTLPNKGYVYATQPEIRSI